MGSDSFQNIERWKNYQQLLSEYSILIYERPRIRGAKQSAG
jgi:nicotinate-nucleotide adenylyltransferase